MKHKQRKIIHIDMDAFYASVEQRDNPLLKGKPVAVGRAEKRGVVSAASYEARKFGVRSAMSSLIAKQKCPSLIFVKPQFEKYKKVSKQIRDIFNEYTDLVEPLSLDEAFLDVTVNKKNMQSATLIAKEIREKIFKTTMLTASAGISVNKFLAKIASDYNKPNGQCVIPPEEAEKFVEDLPIEKFFGIGKVTAEKMKKYGIFKGIDLKNNDLAFLIKHFGKQGEYYYNIARANDNREVNPDRIRKSLSTEYTFDKDLTTKFEIITELYKIEKELIARMQKSNYYGRTITLKVKFANFEQITRSKTFNKEIKDFKTIHKTAKELIYTVDLSNVKIRLLGLGVSNKEDTDYKQLSFEI